MSDRHSGLLCFFSPAIVIPVYFFYIVQIFPLQSDSIRIMFLQPPCWQNYKLWANAWRKKSPWSCVMLSSESCKACLFLDLPHNNTLSSPHTQCLKRTAAQSWLRKQPRAITTPQTGAAHYRKTSNHFPVPRLTNRCPVSQYSTWKSPKKDRRTALDFFSSIT